MNLKELAHHVVVIIFINLLIQIGAMIVVFQILIKKNKIMTNKEKIFKECLDEYKIINEYITLKTVNQTSN